MEPLFSLHIPIETLTEPISPDVVIICDQRVQGVSLQTGDIVPVLTLEANLTLAQAGKLLSDQASMLPPYVLTLDSLGQPTGIIATQQLLQVYITISSNQSILLDTLLDTLSEAITIVDTAKIVQFWNNAAENIYDISRERVVGTSLDTHFASESIRLLNTLAEGISEQRVYHIPRPDRHVLINAAPIRQNGEIIGAISIEQDITELVRLNEELADTTAHLHNLQQEMSRFQAADDPFYAIKGHSAPIQASIQSAQKVSQTDATVLIYGESGVGKELFAKAIHQSSKRHDKPFIAINCAAIPVALFESELFGYQGGAFTGAEKKGKPGKLEQAHDGTLFLDEIGELPLELQVKLLRALQERQFYRVGGTEPIIVNTRIIAATNRQLEQMIAEGRFREDLYYRLNVFSLEIPPLRERKEDIPELVQIFIHEYSITHEQPVPRIAPEVMQTLFDYAWPGNIRQLRNVIERLSILQEGGVIQLEHLPTTVRVQAEATSHPPTATTGFPAPTQHVAIDDTYERLSEPERIVAAIERTYGNKKAAADLLGISRGTLYNKLRKYGIDEGE